jgi:hypothetical protein
MRRGDGWIVLLQADASLSEEVSDFNGKTIHHGTSTRLVVSGRTVQVIHCITAWRSVDQDLLVWVGWGAQWRKVLLQESFTGDDTIYTARVPGCWCSTAGAALQRLHGLSRVQE